MQLQGVRVPLVMMFAMLGLFLLFGMERLYTFTRIDQPLARFLSAREEVKSFEVRQMGGRVVVRVTLGPVANLRETYVDLEKGIAAIFGARPFAIEVVDNRTERLLRDYYELHYALQEALATGRFTEMERKVAQAAQRGGLTRAAVYVDTDYLYIQLQRGDRYLYELVPRHADGVTPAPPGDGGARG